MNILALIPARGGSKGITKKNIVSLNGQPLISYSINEAKNSNCINRIIVSTDDDKIAVISKKFGAEVPFLRAKKFSSDKSTILDVVKHAIAKLDESKYSPDIIVILQPTSPIRQKGLVDKAIKKLINTKCSSVISVKPTKDHPDISFIQKNEKLVPLNSNFEKRGLRQDRNDIFSPTGSVYVFWKKTIEKYDSIYGPKIMPVLVKDDEYNVDIDDKFDLFLAEMIIKNWKKWKLKSK